MIQDPIRHIDEPDGRRFLFIRGGKRLALLVGKMMTPVGKPTLRVFPNIQLQTPCTCGQGDCWMLAEQSLRDQFDDYFMRAASLKEWPVLSDLESAVFELVKSTLRTFVQTGLN